MPEPAGKWKVSRDGGVNPVWGRNGRELFFYGADNRLTAVPVRSGATLELGEPVSLFEVSLLNGPVSAIGYKAHYDVTPDGKRFLLNVSASTAPSLIRVILNLTAGLGAAR